MTPDPWQADCLDDWLGRSRLGRLTASMAALACPRQNGKNGVIEVRELFGMIILGERFLHTAHEVKTARKAFKRLKHFFGERADDPGALYPELNALVAEVRNTNGQEAIVLKGGGSVEFVARSSGSGRGFTVDVLVLDEAQDLTNEELEALLPTISAAPLGDPQVIICGTPPDPDRGQTGEVFSRVRAEAETNTHLAWTDFGVADGPLPDVDDRGLWRQTNPALGPGRLGLGTIETERSMLSAEGFARERLGWWGDPATASEGVISLTAWAKLERRKASQPHTAVVAIDVSPDRAWASVGIAAAGMADRTLVMTRTERGTSWVAKAVAQLVTKRDVLEVALYPGSQAGALIPDLIQVGVEFTALTLREMGQACASFQTAVSDGTVEHVGQPELDAAVGNARTRYTSSGESEMWDRRDRAVNLTPLVAASVARFRWAKGDAADYDPLDSIL